MTLLENLQRREQYGLITAYDLARQLGFMSLVEVGVLQEYAMLLPPNALVINIGAGAGTSGLAFLQARDDIRVVTVDNQEEGYGSLLGETNALQRAGLAGIGNHRQILGDSSAVGRDWLDSGGDNPDLVFIDADHSREGCLRDITSWCPIVRPGGYVLLHDYDNLPVWPGVKEAVDPSLGADPGWKYLELIRTVISFRKAP